MTIHDFDMARYLVGDIVEVQACGANLVDPAIREAGDIDTAMVTLRAGLRRAGAHQQQPAAPPTATTSASRRSAHAACCRQATARRPR